MDEQIITDLFDTDWYKFLALFYKYYFHRNLDTEYRSKNRTLEVRIADIIPKQFLIEQLDAAREVRFNPSQLAFLQGTGAFAKDPLGFLDYLRNYQLGEYKLIEQDGQYVMITQDMMWETHWLGLANEALGIYRMQSLDLDPKEVWNEAVRTLRAKIPTLKKLPKGSVLEFGTRRRFSKAWQHREYEILLNETDGVVNATSNVAMAIATGTGWAGTHPHEGMYWEQGIALPQGREAVRASHNLFLTRWYWLLPYPYRMALTDMYGNAFWTDFSPENARLGRGTRWDSGPWKDWVDKNVKFYRSIGLNPASESEGKDAAYSDGLWPLLMWEIQCYAQEMFRSNVYGWGTNGSNDMGQYKALGLTPISHVMKPYLVNGWKVVKLSCNPKKAMGDSEEAKYIMDVFDYNPLDYEAVQPIY